MADQKLGVSFSLAGFGPFGNFGDAARIGDNFFEPVAFSRATLLKSAGTKLTQNRTVMKTSSKTFFAASFAASVSVLGSFPAVAENKPLTCWYGANADFTSATPGDSGKTMGSVEKSGSGDKTFSYIISARDGAACPVQLPLSTETALTVAVVRQDSESCSNDNVSDAGQAPVAGSVTVFETTANSMTAGVRLFGVSPNATYRVFLKCGKQLGAIRTDAEGNGGRTFNYFLRNCPGWGAAREQAAEPQSEKIAFQLRDLAWPRGQRFTQLLAV